MRSRHHISKTDSQLSACTDYLVMADDRSNKLLREEGVPPLADMFSFCYRL